MTPIDYIRIDAEILQLPKSDKAHKLLGLVKGFNSNGLMISNSELGKILQCSEDNVSRLLREIKEYVRIKNPQSRYRKIFYSGVNAEVGQNNSGTKAEVKESTPANKQATPTSEQATQAQMPDITNKKRFTDNNYKYSELDIELSKLLFKLILTNKPDYPEPNFENWADEVRKLREIDKKTPEQIKAVIEYTQADDFWWDKVLSTACLRKKSKSDNVKRIDRIEIQMEKSKNGNSNRTKIRTNSTENLQPFIR